MQNRSKEISQFGGRNRVFGVDHLPNSIVDIETGRPGPEADAEGGELDEFDEVMQLYYVRSHRRKKS
jgi:hypothetical protein